MKLAAALFAVMAVPAAAQDQMQTINAASQIGTVLGSEEPCGLSYNADAVAGWIDTMVAPDNLEFAPMLNTMTMGTAFQIEQMTDTARAAQCHTVERTAKHYGLID